jgi:GNAT superfamily N-acetyltransferase
MATFVEISKLPKDEFDEIVKNSVCSDDKELEDHIKNYAYADSLNGLYKTYFFKSNGKYGGFISFANSEIEADNDEVISQLNILEGIEYPIPILKITILCTFDEYQGKGLGREFIKLSYLLGFIQQELTGCKAIIADANLSAVGFYKKNGFEEIEQFQEIDNNTFSMIRPIYTIHENSEQLEWLIEFAEDYELYSLVKYLSSI